MRIKLNRKISKFYYGLALTVIAFSGISLFYIPRADATTATFTANGSWTVPTGVSSAVFEAWGGGGAGGGSTTNGDGGGGGAGGQYAKTTLTGLVVNDVYTVTVAGTTAGSTGNGTAGGNSYVTNPSSTVIVQANGGAGGAANNGAGGTGSTTGGVGTDVVYAGGSGGTCSGGSAGGGGGGGAGSTGAGGSGGAVNCYDAGTGTASNGGNGAVGPTTKANGGAGSNYGGGGSGGNLTHGGNQSGGTGAQGYVTVTYTVNNPPAAPTLITPGSGATGVSTTPSFTLRTTDAENDYLQYEVQVCSNSSCSAIVSTACQFTDAATGCTGSQTGWSGQNQPSCPTTCTAYTGSSTLTSSTIATYDYQAAALSPGTQYWWRAWAIDPAGSNTASSAATIQSFTTTSAPTTDQCLRGCEYFNGGSKQPFYWAN